eukprot:c11828_g1_i1.p1 GENE.c11828_g1_i1~~c11828_g1_i1.p1  ORF type:complete len:344 (-),score=103.92 c11828_g1_i1:37-1068(-)
MDNNLRDFMDITSATAPVAAQYLEICGGDVEQAVCLYFESQLPEQHQEPQYNFSYTDNHQINRAPSPTRRDPIQTRYAAQTKPLLEKNNSSAMFPVGSNIFFQGTFKEAVEHAKSQNKSLLINVQDYGNFDCQTLDRDVWSLDTLQLFIDQHFVFFQCSSQSDDGKNIQSIFPELSVYPIVVIIDPYTGELYVKFSHPITDISALQTLDQFVDEMKIAKEKQSSLTQQQERNFEQREEEQNIVQHETESTKSENEITNICAEPPIGDPTAISIKLRLPNSESVERRFSPENTIQDIINYACSITKKNENYSVMLPWPKKVFSDLNQRLGDCELETKTILHIEK